LDLTILVVFNVEVAVEWGIDICDLLVDESELLDDGDLGWREVGEGSRVKSVGMEGWLSMKVEGIDGKDKK
jgi:hypothetical protein